MNLDHSVLKPNQKATFPIPAGLKYDALTFTPSDKNISPISINFDAIPRQGAKIDIGEHHVQFSGFVLVQVVGPNGKFLDGVPVSLKYFHKDGSYSYFGGSPNTDDYGIAQFNVPPGAKGVFEVRNFFPFMEEKGQRFNVEAPFDLSVESEDIPVYTIHLTNEQVKALFQTETTPTQSNSTQPTD